MTGRHRRLAATPEPTPRALSAAVVAAVDAAQAAVDDRAGFEESVPAVFADVVWRLHNDHRMVGWREGPEPAFAALSAAATAALPAIAVDIAKRLDAAAAAAHVELDDTESLAELLVRLAHALLLVHHAEPGGRIELDAYVQRHVTPVVRSAIDAGAYGSSRRVPTRRRRMRGEMLVATLIAVLVGSAGWMTAVSKSTPPSVAPTNLTGTIPAPQQRGSETRVTPSPSPSATAAPPAPDAPFSVTLEPSGWTPVQAAPPPFRDPVTAQSGDFRGSDGPTGPGGSDGLDGPAGPAGLPPMAGPRAGLPPQAGPPSRATSVAVNTPGGGFGTPPKFPSAPGSRASGAGTPKPDFHADGGHPDGPR